METRIVQRKAKGYKDIATPSEEALFDRPVPLRGLVFTPSNPVVLGSAETLTTSCSQSTGIIPNGSTSCRDSSSSYLK